MRTCTDELVELLAREHCTVEGLLADLAEVEGNELYDVLHAYSQMTKDALIDALTR